MSDEVEDSTDCNWPSCHSPGTYAVTTTIGGILPGLYYACDEHVQKFRPGLRFDESPDGTIHMGLKSKLRGQCVVSAVMPLDK